MIIWCLVSEFSAPRRNSVYSRNPVRESFHRRPEWVAPFVRHMGSYLIGPYYHSPKRYAMVFSDLII
jgi:hypothetical protein